MVSNTAGFIYLQNLLHLHWLTVIFIALNEFGSIEDNLSNLNEFDWIFHLWRFLNALNQILNILPKQVDMKTFLVNV